MARTRTYVAKQMNPNPQAATQGKVAKRRAPDVGVDRFLCKAELLCKNDDMRKEIKELEDKYSNLFAQNDELMESYNKRANDVARYRDLYHEAVAERITREQFMQSKFKAAMTLGKAAKKRAKKAEKERSYLQERLDWYTTTYGALHSPAPTLSSPSVSDIGFSDTEEY